MLRRLLIGPHARPRSGKRHAERAARRRSGILLIQALAPSRHNVDSGHRILLPPKQMATNIGTSHPLPGWCLFLCRENCPVTRLQVKAHVGLLDAGDLGFTQV